MADTIFVDTIEETCPACGSDGLVEHAVYDGFAWVHELMCQDCWHALESISYLGKHPTWGSPVGSGEPSAST